MGGKTKTKIKEVAVENPLNTKMEAELAEQKEKYNQLQSTFDSEMLKLRGQYETSQGKLSSTQQSLTDYMNRLSGTQEQLSTTKGQLSTTQEKFSSSQQSLNDYMNRLATTSTSLSDYKDRLAATSTSLSDYKDRLAGTQGQLSTTQGQLSATKGQLQETAQSLNMTKAEFDKWKSAQGTTVIKDGMTAGQTIDTAKDVSTNRQEVSKPTSSTDLFTRRIINKGTTENLSNTGLSAGKSSSSVYAGLKI